MSDKFCGTCGSPLQPGDLFCRNCGAAVNVNEKQAVSSTAQAQAKFSRLRRFLQIILVLSLIVAIIGSILSQSNSNDILLYTWQLAFVIVLLDVIALFILNRLIRNKQQTVWILIGFGVLILLGVTAYFITSASSVNQSLNELTNEDSTVRAAAATSLGKKKVERAVEPLITTLGDPVGEVRSAAASALGDIGDKKALSPLIELLNDPDGPVRLSAIYSIGELKDSRAVNSLNSILWSENSNSTEIRSAASALGKIGAPSIEALKYAMINGRSLVQEAAAQGFGEMGTPAVDTLLSILTLSNMNIRLNAAYAISKINDPRAVDRLGIALAQNDMVMIAGAYEYYIHLGSAGSESSLIQALNTYGNEQMAETYLNCGNKQLVEAATNWAQASGFRIFSMPGSSSAVWGK